VVGLLQLISLALDGFGLHPSVGLGRYWYGAKQLKGKTDIRFTYKPYPLDGTCNAALPQKGDGSRCTLAAFALCAEKLAGKGWDMHHWIFEKQEDIFSVTDAKKLLPEISHDLGIDAAQLSDCADSSEIYDQIKTSALEGDLAKVEGTPTIYMNGKKLPWGQFLLVLKEASNLIK
jgi:protein-disulfide isomerase